MKINKMNVVALRNLQGWSQEDLAAAAGISVRTVQRVETEGVASQDTSHALAAAFNVESNQICMPEWDWAWAWWAIKALLKIYWPLALMAIALTMVGGLLVSKGVITETTAAYWAGCMLTMGLYYWMYAFLKVYEKEFGKLNLKDVKWF